MDFTELLKKRHSIRYFEDISIPRDVLSELVREAQTAPSAVNAQDYRVWCCEGNTLEAIRREYHQRFEEKAPHCPDLPLMSNSDYSESAQRERAKFSQARKDAGLQEIKELSESYLFHAPAVFYLCVPKTATVWTLLDLGAFEQTLLLAAANRGLGSIPAYNLIKYPDILRKYLGIRDDLLIAMGVAVGYEADVPLNRFRSQRKPLEETLTFVD